MSIARTSASSIVSRRPARTLPALLTSRSIPPPWSATSITRWCASGSVRSRASSRAVPPAARTSSAVAASVPGSRPTSSRSAPRAANANAIALPIPRPPPVITPRRFDRSRTGGSDWSALTGPLCRRTDERQQDGRTPMSSRLLACRLAVDLQGEVGRLCYARAELGDGSVPQWIGATDSIPELFRLESRHPARRVRVPCAHPNRDGLPAHEPGRGAAAHAASSGVEEARRRCRPRADGPKE